MKTRMGELAVNLSITLIKVGVYLYDIITFPVYAILQFPWKNHGNGLAKTELVAVSEGVCIRSDRPLTDLFIEIERKKIDTLAKLHDFSCKKYGDQKALGTRAILSEFSETQKNGKVFKKYDMGDYNWLTYTEANDIAVNFGRGLRAIGHQPKENIMILSETRQEWLLSAMGTFKQSIPLCTLYATLGQDGLVHGINETDVHRLIVSHDLLPKVKEILPYCPKVKSIIYFTDQIHETVTSGFHNMECVSFDEVVKKGRDFKGEDRPPSATDVAIIMYTSGSTGVPKGVVINHSNMICSITSFAISLQPIPGDIYLAYLPLAHILEIIGESIMLLFGIQLGYSSPLTMTDRSTKVKRGCKGDVSVLHPTIIPCVPLILDRIYKGILEKVASQGSFLVALFNYGVSYKNKWFQRGWGTPICNWFVFRKIRALLGGSVRLIVGGGAPLSADTHNFIRASIGCKVLQGYGLTETCSCATFMDLPDRSTGMVGTPLHGCDIKLVDWEEGNYCVTDKPNPRGEIIVGGGNVAVGYFKNPEKTREDFIDMDGKRWFRTGDIGEFNSYGSLKIIDRKKDLVKLQIGEYVSLGKVEAALKISPFVDNLCVYADPYKNNAVAIISPKIPDLKKFASSRGINVEVSPENLCSDPLLVKEVVNELAAIAKKVKLEKFEIPTAVHLTTDSWCPDSGLVTAAFKLKRKPIQIQYQDAINTMYSNGVVAN